MELISLKGDHPGIIPMKFGDNPPFGLGVDVVQSTLLTDHGRTTDIIIAHLELS